MRSPRPWARFFAIGRRPEPCSEATFRRVLSTTSGSVAVLIALGLLIGLGLTAFNVMAIYRLSAERTKQRSDQARVEADAAKTRASATALQSSLDRSNILLLASETNEANTLIEQRTFSWTAFFGLVEKTLPFDARLILRRATRGARRLHDRHAGEHEAPG
jgi:hypothetical protein